MKTYPATLSEPKQNLALSSMGCTSVHHLHSSLPEKVLKPNRRLQAGDQVLLLENARVDGYWYEPSIMCRGDWTSHIMLAGSVGTVVTPRTAFVTSKNFKDKHVFANVDIQHNGVTSRVRVAHGVLKVLKRAGDHPQAH